MPTPTKPSDPNPPPLPPPPLDPHQLLHPIRSGSLGVIKNWGEPAGVILERCFTADLVSFGGAVGASIDRNVEQVIPIGEPRVMPPRSYLERQWCLRRRIYWINWQQQITEAYPADRRAEILIARLTDQFSPNLIEPLPDLILAKLIGVTPAEVRMAREPDWALQA